MAGTQDEAASFVAARRRRRIVVVTGLVAAGVVIMGAAIGSAVQERASSDSSSPVPSSGCEIPDRWTPAIEAGALNKEKACQELRPGQQEIPTTPQVMHSPEGPSLAIEDWVHEEWIPQCRTGSFPLGEGNKAAKLYCNAILKVAAGELEPTHICEPPECSEPELVWAYDKPNSATSPMLTENEAERR